MGSLERQRKLTAVFSRGRIANSGFHPSCSLVDFFHVIRTDGSIAEPATAGSLENLFFHGSPRQGSAGRVALGLHFLDKGFFIFEEFMQIFLDNALA